MATVSARRRLIDISGERFGLLTVIEYSSPGTKTSVSPKWKCKCACGNMVDVRGSDLKTGNTKSCGCIRKIRGLLRDIYREEYKSWGAMRSRCIGRTPDKQEYYGDVSICERWTPKNAFVLFIADMGPKPSPRHTIDRIDNSKGYAPENCRWATRKQQANNRSGNTPITIHGETKTIQEWCDLSGNPNYLVSRRIRRGWAVERAVFTPSKRGAQQPSR